MSQSNISHRLGTGTIHCLRARVQILCFFHLSLPINQAPSLPGTVLEPRETNVEKHSPFLGDYKARQNRQKARRRTWSMYYKIGALR